MWIITNTIDISTYDYVKFVILEIYRAQNIQFWITYMQEDPCVVHKD